MAIITPDENGEVGGFDKFPSGDHAVLFNELKFHTKDKETQPLVLWLVWNHIDNENMQISQYLDFSKPRGIKDFITAIRVSGVADKMKKQYEGLFGGTSGYDIDDDRILEKSNGLPVKVKDTFLMAIKNILNGTIVGVHVEEDKKGYVNIKKYIPIDKLKAGSQSQPGSQASQPVKPKAEYNF